MRALPLVLLLTLMLALKGLPVSAKSIVKIPLAAMPTSLDTGTNLQDVSGVLAIVRELLLASNRHQIDEVMKHYSPQFVSGDRLTLDQVKKLILETWKLYPDIQYDSRTLDVRVAGDWATVESMDHAKATAQPDPAFSSQKAEKGSMESYSRGLLFLKRVGGTWEVVGDQTLFEHAAIMYGDMRNVKLLLSSPDVIQADQAYTAKLDVQVPVGKLMIASITKDPLVYPQRIPQEKFRSLGDDQSSLERVFSANHDNLNEMITATVGLTEVTQDKDERPSIKLNGIATLVKRVNVSPKLTAPLSIDPSSLVRRSANGLIDLGKVDTLPPKVEDDDTKKGPLKLSVPESNRPSDKPLPSGETTP